MDTTGSGLVMLAAHSVGAVALAAFVATPGTAHAPRSESAIVTTRTAAAPSAIYAAPAEICGSLDATAHPLRAARLRSGTAVRVLRVDAERCDGFTVPILEVRVVDRDSPLDGKRGFLVAGAAPMPLADDAT